VAKICGEIEEGLNRRAVFIFDGAPSGKLEEIFKCLVVGDVMRGFGLDGETMKITWSSFSTYINNRFGGYLFNYDLEYGIKDIGLNENSDSFLRVRPES
jgi:hypothetical protein